MNGRRSAAEEEIERERCVLLEVLELFPAVLTVDELIRARVSPLDGETNVQKQAIRELCRHGLLRLDGESIYPTMAAIRTYQMFELEGLHGAG